MKKLLLRALFIIFIIRFSIGCGAFVHGTTQTIQINSSPADAEVWINGEKVGTTPTEITLKRKNEYLLAIKIKGYKLYTVKIKQSTSEAILLDIFGAPLSCWIDYSSGGAYYLSPDKIDVNLDNLSELDGQTLLIPEKYYESINEIRFLDNDGKPRIKITIK